MRIHSCRHAAIPSGALLIAVVLATILATSSTAASWITAKVRLNSNARSHRGPAFWPRQASENEHPETPNQKVSLDFYIRDSMHAELSQAADIIVASFYVDSRPPWNQLYRLAELDRLQQGFPFQDRTLHRMIVAVTRNPSSRHEVVVGFVDIDARTPNRPTGFKYNPRPYLSDLCVHPNFRRRGIAQALVQFCEHFCAERLGKAELFIRVEQNNESALGMYQRLGYARVPNPDDPSVTVVLLKKQLPHGAEERSASLTTVKCTM
jgi:ribosomal protein S18 acetylase RimI-like enzyme